METGDSNPPTSPLPPTKPDKPAGKSKLAWIVAAIMTLAASGFAYLYFTQESEQPAQQNQESADTDSQDADSEADTNRTIYQAEVGKFKINLSNTYGVVEGLDDNFEGGPATSIELGIIDVAGGVENVVVTNPGQPFSVFARPESGATLAGNSRSAALDANELASREADITFADTPARVYRGDGLFITKHIVFVKNNIAYEITLLSEDQTQADMLAAVEAGWEFTE